MTLTVEDVLAACRSRIWKLLFSACISAAVFGIGLFCLVLGTSKLVLVIGFAMGACGIAGLFVFMGASAALTDLRDSIVKAQKQEGVKGCISA